MSSCQNCKHREVGCHSKCENYKTFQEQMTQINEKRKKFNHSLNIILKSYNKSYT